MVREAEEQSSQLEPGFLLNAAAASPAAMQSSVPLPGCTARRARLPPLPHCLPPFRCSTICDDPDMKYGPDLQQGGCKLCAVERCANCQVRMWSCSG